jgi:hypothetical protein
VLTPRQELTTVFYAFHAESAVNASTANLATKATTADTALYAKAIVGTTAESHSITGSSSSAGTLKLYEDTDDGTNFVSLKAATMDADVNYTLPISDGASGQVLSTDGSGTLSWTVSGASSINGLSDALIEDNSMYLGSTPTTSTSDDKAKSNIAVGTTALAAITTGDYNVAIGDGALHANETGAYNTAIGHKALHTNTLQHNTALGGEALYYNTTGGSNTAVGHRALYNNTTASYNTALGLKAGEDVTTGDQNIIIGANTASWSATASNQIVIGSGATGHGDNIAVIGNGSLTAIHPSDDDEVDLGSSSYEYKDLYLDGTIYFDGESLNDGFAKRKFWSSNNEIGTDPTDIIADGTDDAVYGASIAGIVFCVQDNDEASASQIYKVLSTPSSGSYTTVTNSVTFTMNSNGSLTVHRDSSVSGVRIALTVTWF